ncbi:MAG: GNAT family N-acetyltransferase [Anaerolineales bacterium]|jgi:predicted GNAT family acetyltransferase
MKSENIKVTHNPEENRFELILDGHLAVLTYTMFDDIIIFTHTGVPPEIEGGSVGAKLAQTGLEYARDNGLRVRSKCWFVSKYLKRHPEYQDLVR